ncbi:tyrosine-type recombinase/integrase [Brevundimonas sp.]|uniref:tyrosine-type recombinase/integrase n=1 Tax=Brevundimonas sp. TaxID=1871086 RepID=UPI0028A5A08E|nr:integrase arm-type DNA-binding domain-containing protein [Brevundimonas sp.]
MARQVNRLTATQVKTLRAPGRHADGNGLYLVVDPAGGRRWVLFYQSAGKRREMGLGSVGEVTLAEAREAARQAKGLARTGTDPIEARKAAAGAAVLIPTLGEAADSLITDLAPGWRSAKTAAHWRRSLQIHAKAVSSKRIDRITTEDVLVVLRPLWVTKPETAAIVRQRLERVLDGAKVKGWREGENPARWRGHLAHILPKPRKLVRGHFPAMPFDDLPAFMALLTTQSGVTARVLEWTILTAARESMALGASWGELDMRAMVWTIPAGRMKTNKELRVPITTAMMAVLDRVRPPAVAPDELIFAGNKPGRPLSNMAMDMLLRRHAPGYVPHGFRSTFRDWAGEKTDFAREVAEAALAHTVGDETERAYRRGDALEKRRALMEAWASFATSSARKPTS